MSKVIQDHGIVGAGGAGFPTHVKASAKAEIVIANGAECEPLLHKDKELARAYPEKVIEGLELLMRATGAKEGVLTVKGKYADIVEGYEKALKGKSDIRVRALGDFYPSGDEFSLVFDVTGKLIPPGGIPIAIGVVVANVETLYNVAAGVPVTETFLTVAGAVKNPVTLVVPVGTSIADVLAMAGGAAIEDFAVLDGGAMMGKVETDLSSPVTKTTGGLIVLPKEHFLIRKKMTPRGTYSRIGKSACDQCTYCTQFCPRYLLGYAIEPHKVMRSLGFAGDKKKLWSEWALLCCECSICSLYACPEELDPKNVCVSAKGDLREKKVGWKESSLAAMADLKAHPMRDFRKIPLDRLTRKLGLKEYQADAPLRRPDQKVRRVRVPLKQHVGAAAEAVVKKGDKVKIGRLLGEIPAGKLGARVHASIAGVVTGVDSAVTIEG